MCAEASAVFENLCSRQTSPAAYSRIPGLQEIVDPDAGGRVAVKIGGFQIASIDVRYPAGAGEGGIDRNRALVVVADQIDELFPILITNPDGRGIRPHLTPERPILASLGACTAITLKMVAHRRQLPLTGVQVERQLNPGKSDDGFVILNQPLAQIRNFDSSVAVGARSRICPLTICTRSFFRARKSNPNAFVRPTAAGDYRLCICKLSVADKTSPFCSAAA